MLSWDAPFWSSNDYKEDVEEDDFGCYGQALMKRIYNVSEVDTGKHTCNMNCDELPNANSSIHLYLSSQGELSIDKEIDR